MAYPDRDLGPPPSARAVAGRMNARGISVFYGATEPEIALAEVRPPVGSRVTIARFDVIRPLRLLDVAALRAIIVDGSVFDRDYIHRLRKAVFLERLGERIVMPVMPEDEPADYLITQAIADYLAGLSNPIIDGIVFPSVQSRTPGSNVVLFHKSSRVKPMDIPQGAEIDARLEETDDEGTVPAYYVWERRPLRRGAPVATDLPWPMSMPYTMRDEDVRPFTLQVDPTNIKVHHVRAVSFTTEDHDVTRHVYDDPGTQPFPSLDETDRRF